MSSINKINHLRVPTQVSLPIYNDGLIVVSVDRLEEFIRNYAASSYISRDKVIEAVGEDDILTRDEADGKCEDIGTNVNAYIKEARNELRHQIRQKLNLTQEEQI